MVELFLHFYLANILPSIFLKLKHLGLGCRVVPVYAGAFGYAEDLALLAPSIYSLKQMIEVCASFANFHFIEFNLIKSKLLCFNCDTLNVLIFVGGKRILVPVASHDRHLGNYIMLAISINVVIG